MKEIISYYLSEFLCLRVSVANLPVVLDVLSLLHVADCDERLMQHRDFGGASH